MIIKTGSKGKNEKIKYVCNTVDDVCVYINKYIYKDGIIDMKNINDVLNQILSNFKEKKIRETVFKKSLSDLLKDKFGETSCKKINKNYWRIRGYSNVEQEEHVSREQASRTQKKTAESYRKSSETWYKNQHLHRQDRGVDYYMSKGYSFKEAKEKVDNRTQKWLLSFNQALKNDPTINKRRGTTRVELEKKYGVTRASEIIKTRLCCFKGISGVQLSFIEDIIKECSLKKSDCLYGDNEFFISTKNAFYLYDFTTRNKIIEFNGDFWHCNPDIYNEGYINPVTKLSREETHAKDKEKVRVAIEKGFKCLTIWENNYRKDKDEVLKKVKAFLSDEKN
jgi:hypothetical protein